MIVSDHGMTEGGNHGGCSYEETDALSLFISEEKINEVVETNNEVYQVDIAATLALLFGVPIPKNNVGTMMFRVLSSLKDEHHLRMLELNAWQLMRLLQAHIPGLDCEKISCDSGSSKSDGAEKFCCSYLEATALHESWKSKRSLRSAGDDYRSIASAYYDFLSKASKWLSNRATDKPIGLITSGITALLLSCLGLLSLLFLLDGGGCIEETQHLSYADYMLNWRLDKSFIGIILFVLVLSMGSSSMVEEEQYICYFMTSSLYLIFLRRIIQSSNGKLKHALCSNDDQKFRSYSQMYYVSAVLVSGRILRGWHQGGVNWTYLPDISKFLEQAGTQHINLLHLISVVLVIVMSFAAIFMKQRLKIHLIVVLMLVYLFPSLLILNKILEGQSSILTSSITGNTGMIQNFFAVLGISSGVIIVVTPWLTSLHIPINFTDTNNLSTDTYVEIQNKILLERFKDSMYVIGWCYVFSWSLLQLLLQQPINSMPVSLLLMQILATIQCFSEGNPQLSRWVKVAAMYYVGMAGHFGLGNTNTLATIDVAGAFIGISSHSTVISGVLMFMITYASPILSILSTLMDVSTKELTNVKDIDYGHMLKTTLGYPCLVPLGLNSILLLAYTIILLLMRNHLFVWSVFSPKYLYVCATTVCVYVCVLVVALSATYAWMAFALCRMMRGY